MHACPYFDGIVFGTEGQAVGISGWIESYGLNKGTFSICVFGL